VVVIGGGPAGASAAVALARRGIDVLLVERSDGRGNAIGETLAPSANPLLQRLGLGGVLGASGAIPSYGNRSSWGGDGAMAERDFLRDAHGHGWHLDRPAFNSALLEVAAEAGTTIWRNARVVSCRQDEMDGRRVLNVAAACGQKPLTANFVVDASGRAAIVSRGLGMRRRVADRQVAAVALLERLPAATPMHDSATLVEAAERGWWYSAPLPDGRLVVVWFSDPDLLAADGAWRVTGWTALLRASKLTWERVATNGLALPERVEVRAAGSSLLPRPAGDSWIAVGDAAAAFDPLSSHGIGSALAGGARAAAAVAERLAGDDEAISRYADGVLADFAYYLWLRCAYYEEERRWPHGPFWNRRHGG
jgi:flavin-dependent dehydrogenase